MEAMPTVVLIIHTGQKAKGGGYSVIRLGQCCPKKSPAGKLAGYDEDKLSPACKLVIEHSVLKSTDSFPSVLGIRQ